MIAAVLEPERCADENLPGDLPSRLRLKVSDTSGNNQLGCIWGIRSRYYDSAATAALFYEAEALTPINGAAVTGLSGASGGDVVTIKSLPAASWVTMLSTTISATTGNWTHQGSYRVWARCYSATGTPTFRFLWGVGSLSVPVTNDAVTLPAAGAYYLLDLGEVRIDYPRSAPTNGSERCRFTRPEAAIRRRSTASTSSHWTTAPGSLPTCMSRRRLRSPSPTMSVRVRMRLASVAWRGARRAASSAAVGEPRYRWGRAPNRTISRRPRSATACPAVSRFRASRCS